MARSLWLALLLAQAGFAFIDKLELNFPSITVTAGATLSNTSLPKVEAKVLDADGRLVLNPNVDNRISVLASVLGPQSVLLSNAASVSATFTAGVATFTGPRALSIKKAGTWRVLFTLPPQGAIKTLVEAVSSPVTVLPGSAAALRLDTQPGRATGGLPFSAQPSVSIIDASDNDQGECNVSPLDGVEVTVSVLLTPAGAAGALLLIPAAKLKVLTVGGIATFSSLAFGPAGDGYKLRFSARLPSGAAVTVDSRVFTVGVGPTAMLILSTQPSAIRAGHAFGTQPVVKLHDAGGNVCVDDSTSTVTVSLYDPDTSPLTGDGRAARQKLARRGRSATLGPLSLRFLYPFSLVKARVLTLPSEHVELNVDPGELGNAGALTATLRTLPSLRGGDRIALGGPESGWTPSDAATGTSAVLLVDDGEGSTQVGSTPPTSPYPVFPALGRQGVVVKLVRPPAETRVRLTGAWPGSATGGWVRLSKVESALTRPVVAGVATFTGLRLDTVGERYRLLFTSSLVNASESVVAGELDPVSGAWTGGNSRKAPLGLGSGAVGFGHGFGGTNVTSGPTAPVPRRVSVLSDALRVEPGDPFRLVVLRPAGRAWAGGQPFATQPIVALSDAGGNTLTDREEDRITVSLALPSDLGATGYTDQFLVDCGTLLAQGVPGGNRTLETGLALTGTLKVKPWGGVAEWWDLGIDEPSLAGGNQFVVVYSSTLGSGRVLRACQPLYVAASAETLLAPFQDPTVVAGDGTALPTLDGNGGAASVGDGRGQRGSPALADRFGHAVSVTEDVALVGAPFADEPTPEVQVVRLLGGIPAGTQVLRPETQTITISAVWRPAVQLIKLFGPDTASGLPTGTFVLSYTHAPDDQYTRPRVTRDIPVSATSAALASIIEDDLLYLTGEEHNEAIRGFAGRVTVSRVLQSGREITTEEETEGGLDDLKVTGVFTRAWQVTFNNVYGALPLLVADDAGLTNVRPRLNPNFNAVEVTQVQTPTVLGGTFKLAMPVRSHPAATQQTADHGAGDAALPAFALSAPSAAALTHTSALPWNVDAVTLGLALQQKLHTGPVYVDTEDIPFVEQYVGGQAIGARRITVKFAPRPGSVDVPTLQPDATGLTGHGAYVAVRTPEPGLEPLGGSFTLSVLGEKTPALKIDATAAQVRTALLATGLVIDASVTRFEAPSTASEDGWPSAHPDYGQDGGVESPVQGPSWAITFLQLAREKDAHDSGGAYNLDGIEGEVEQPLLVWDRYYAPLLDPDGLELGTTASFGGTWTQCKLPSGQTGAPSGYTTGWFDGMDPDATDPVRPSLYCDGGGVNEATGGPPLGFLLGTGAGVDIVRAGSPVGAQPWRSTLARPGGRGTDTGAAYVFTRRLGSGEWARGPKLRASGGEPTSLFGHAVALAAAPHWERVMTGGTPSTTELHAFAAVAAPGARMYGEVEVQQLECVATGGAFALLFRGHRTAYLEVTATAADVQTALNVLPAAIRVSVTIVGSVNPSDVVCHSSSPPKVRVTFHWPRDGDLPALVADSVRLTHSSTPSLTVTEVVKGVSISSGADATGALAGAVYVFEPAQSGNPNGVRGTWSQTARLDPPGPVQAGGMGVQTLFGWSVASTLVGGGGRVHTIAVGAPGDERDGGYEAGAVHIYTRKTTADGLYGVGAWSLSQTLVGTNIARDRSGGAGFRFGWSVAFSSEGDTLVIGAPGGALALANDGSVVGKHGRVFVFTRQRENDAWFFVDQVFDPPAISSAWTAALPMYAFGTSVALGTNSMVVGAPHALSTGGGNRGEATGGAYIYDRLGWGTSDPLNPGLDSLGAYALRSTAFPEAARGGDRIGLSVAASDHIVVLAGVSEVLGVEDAAAGGGGVGDQGDATPALVHAGAGAAGWPVSAPLHEVHLLDVRAPLPPGVSPSVHLGGTFTLHWRGRSSRRLPWNARPRTLRSALENDLLTGQVKVSRSGPVGTALSFQWRVTFLGVDAASLPGVLLTDAPTDGVGLGTRPLPLLRASTRLVLEAGGLTATTGATEAAADAAVASGRAVLDPPHFNGTREMHALPSGLPPGWPRPTLRVVRLSTPSRRVRGAAYVYARDHGVQAAGYGAGSEGYKQLWFPTAALAPVAWQSADQYAASCSMSRSGRVAMVGAPARDTSWAQGPGSHVTGAAFLSTLFALNARFTSAVTFDKNDVGSVVGLDEHDAAAVAAAGPNADSVSRGAHAGLGIAVSQPFVVRVCDPSCLVPPWPMTPPTAGAWVNGAAFGPSAARPQANVGAGQVYVYVSASDGDDWGYHAATGGVTPPYGSVAARAHTRPATSTARGDGTGWLSPGAAAAGLGPASSLDLSALSWDATGSPSLERYYAQAGVLTPVTRTAHGGASACADGSANTPECSFVRGAVPGLDGSTPVVGGYDSRGVQDFVRATRTLALELVRGTSTTGTTSQTLLGFPQALPHSRSFSVTVADDGVAEPVDEIFHTRVWQPGLHPMYGGRLWQPVLIRDDGDGTVGAKGYLQTLLGAPQPPPPGGSPIAPTAPTSYDEFELGADVAMDSTGTFAVSGAPGAAPHGRVRFLKYTSGAWTPLYPDREPPPTTAALTLSGVAVRFGAGVAMWNGGSGGSASRWAAVGAPGAASVVLYRWDSVASAWVQHATALRPDMLAAVAAGIVPRGATVAKRVDHTDSCGEAGSVAFLTDLVSGVERPLLAIGCAGQEAVFIFRASGTALSSTWSNTLVLRAGDFASYTPGGGSGSDQPSLPVPSWFGTRVAGSGRTLVVSAPRAGLVRDESARPRAPSAREQADVEEEREASGHGQVYVFLYAAGVSTAMYDGLPDNSGDWASLLAWVAGDEWLAAHPGTTIKDLAVYDDGGGTPALWVQHVTLTPPDRLNAPGTRFGASLAVAGTTIVVGAPGAAGGSGAGGSASSGRSNAVTWDFESGDLTGWTAVGDAFAHQPVWGDNPGARPGYPNRLGPAPPTSARPRGRYFVSTYDARPADVPASYDAPSRRRGHAGEVVTGVLATWTPLPGVESVESASLLDALNNAVNTPIGRRTAVPGSSMPAGYAQGDGPTGSMTSLSFLIAGESISLLVGGGCEERAVYVELLVDGSPALKATGACDVAMQRVVWDVRPHLGKMGALRVVDASSTSPWGHIMVDEIQVGWDTGRFLEAGAAGAAMVYTLVVPVTDVDARSSGGGHTRTSSEPRQSSTLPAGRILGRNLPFSHTACGAATSPFSCLWLLEAVLRPSDGRAGWAFGTSVAVAEDAALILVGSPNAGAPLDSWLAGPAGPARGTDAQHALAPHGWSAGAFHGGHASARADGGLNTGVWGYGFGSTWVGGERSGGEEGSLAGSTLDAAATADGAGSALSAEGRPALSPGLASSVGNSQGGRTATPWSGAFGFGSAGARGKAGERPDKSSGSVWGRNPFAPAYAGLGHAAGPGAVYVYRAEAEKRSSGPDPVTVRNRLWTPTGFEHSVLDAPALHAASGHPTRSHAVRLGVSVSARGFKALIGAPGVVNGRGTEARSGPRVDHTLFQRTGAVLHVDLGYTYLSFDPTYHTDPATQQGAGAGGAHFAHRNPGARHGSYKVGASGVRVEHYTVSESAGTRGPKAEISVPVYRLGVHASAGSVGGGLYGTHPAGSPQALLAPESLHVAFGTRDVTARSVSDAVYASCMRLLPDARGPASCGDYVSQAGLLSFAPTTRRQDVIIPIIDDGCPEPDTETFILQLYLPGGARIRGYGYALTIRIDDDDMASPFSSANSTSRYAVDDVSAQALDGAWQPAGMRPSHVWPWRNVCAPEDVPVGLHANQHLPPLTQPRV